MDTVLFTRDGLTCALASPADLCAIQAMFSSLVSHMNQTGITIWNAVYPNEVFPEDIEENRLYVVRCGGDIAAVFALLEPFADPARSTVEWSEETDSAMYLYRLGVAVEHLGKGYACAAVEFAKAIVRAKGYKYLRLFAVDTNTPAVNLYLKNGFRKAVGTRIDDISTDEFLIESGFEVKV